MRFPVLSLLLIASSLLPLHAQIREATNLETQAVEESAVAHFREELGVNEMTTPLVGTVFSDLGLFQPLPLDLVRSFNLKQSFPTRFQTALQFGALVANGFVATLARQKQLIVDTGRALIREANTLSAGQRLTGRSKSLFELSDRGDWQGLREELNATQEDVEESMLELKDGEMADLISLGGWLRGFQLAAHVTADHYTAEKAAALVRPDLMDYFIARMDCLNPAMKKRPNVITIASSLKTIRAVSVQAKSPTQGDVAQMRDLADVAMKAALGTESLPSKLSLGLLHDERLVARSHQYLSPD